MNSQLINPQLVDHLDVESLPRGQKTRLMLALVTDGLGRPVRIPVIVARGRKEGPTFGITSAVHGNELNGVPVIDRLFDRLELSRLRGTIVAAVVANVPGFDRHQREFSDGTDLNQVMPGSPTGNAAEIYARRLVERLGLSSFDYLVDLHTASFGRINSLYVRADMTDPVCAQMAYLQRPQIVVHNAPSDRTLRGTAMDHGVPAITVEVGNPQRFQPSYIRSALIGLRAVLDYAGMLSARRSSAKRGAPPFVCSRSAWLRTDHGGLLEVFVDLTDKVSQGDRVARLTNIFGDITREYVAPYDGVVVGKSVDPVARTGDRIVHLGVPAREGELAIERRADEVPELLAVQVDSAKGDVEAAAEVAPREP